MNEDIFELGSTTQHKNAGAILSQRVGGSLGVALAILSFIIF